jgi:hypothetical protein
MGNAAFWQDEWFSLKKAKARVTNPGLPIGMEL